MAQPFIAEKEKRFVSPDRPADVPPKVVALKRAHLVRCSGAGRLLVEEVASVKEVVAQEIESLAVEGICARTRSDLNDSPGIPSFVRTVGRIVNLEFGNGVDRRLERQLAVGHVVQVDAVHHDVVFIFPVSSRIEAEGTLTTQGEAEKTIGWRYN